MATEEGSEKKPGVKIQDLSPKKDAKGGGGTRNLDNANLDNANLDNSNLDGNRNVDSAGGKGAN